MYPLVFAPLFKEIVWGGRRLAGLGKPLPNNTPIGESWEVVDLPDDQSVVAEGALAGVTLHALCERDRDALLGPVALDGGRFPLLVKYIDANRTLSVQVHPDEHACARMGKGRPKNEAWVILDAEPDALLYLGLQPGTTREQLEASIADGSIEARLVKVPAKPGMLVPVRPGTLHAIGAGIVLAEVQQPSDTTYRVYDWGRVGLDGKPRQLHVADSLTCTRLDAAVDTTQSSLDAGHFLGEIHDLAERASAEIAVDGSGPRVVVALDGRARLTSAALAAPITLSRGKVVLVPHSVTATVSDDDGGKVLLVRFPAR